MIIVKRDLMDVLADMLPGKRFSITEDHHGKHVLNYDTDLSIDEVTQLKDVLKKLKVKIQLERMPL